VDIIYSKGLESYTSKPDEAQIQHMRFRTIKQSFKELINEIETGHSFLCGSFHENERSTKRFCTQHLFAVDIDKDLTLHQATDMLAEYGLHYTFGYHTFSHTNENERFRLVFVMEEEVRDVKLVSDINKALYFFFDKKSDRQAVDVPRIWSGTNKKCFFGPSLEPFKLIDFLDCVNQKVYGFDHGKLRNGVDLNKVVVNFRPEHRNTIIIYNNKSNISTSSDPLCLKKEDSRSRKFENVKPEDLFYFELFKMFYEGRGFGEQNKLTHEHLVCIATNLLYVSGGEQLFKECLDKNSNYGIDKYRIFGYVKRRKYHAQTFKTCSLLDEDKTYQTFVQLLTKRGKITVYDEQEPELITLETAERIRDEAFQKILAATDQKIYLVKLAPGLGKTEIIKNIKNAVVAFPDHTLKDEHFNSSKLSAEERLSTPDLKNLFSPHITKRFEEMYAMDLAKNVMVEVEALAVGSLTCYPSTDRDRENAQTYLQQLEEIKEAGSSKSVFTTHKRAIQNTWAHNCIVFDEDPEQVILEHHFTVKKDLALLSTYLKNHGLKTNDLDVIINEMDFDSPKPLPKFNFDKKTLSKLCELLQFTSRVLKFFQAESYFINNGRVHYCINNSDSFCPFTKYIICDATAKVEVYRKLFGDRLKVIDVSNVKNKGNIVQHTSYSCSMTGITNAVTHLPIDFSLPTITFKTKKCLFPNAIQEMHFGRVRGSNTLSGFDINVVGTYNYHQTYYRFLAFRMGIVNEDWKMKYQLVRYNGREFMFMTYSDPHLQAFHLNNVESELLQAVHRARLLRHTRTVYLYSNFPLQQATYVF
jgi:hypothetical protein